MAMMETLEFALIILAGCLVAWMAMREVQS